MFNLHQFGQCINHLLDCPLYLHNKIPLSQGMEVRVVVVGLAIRVWRRVERSIVSKIEEMSPATLVLFPVSACHTLGTSQPVWSAFREPGIWPQRPTLWKQHTCFVPMDPTYC